MFFIAVLIIAALMLFLTYICYRMAFYAPDMKTGGSKPAELPKGHIYEEYRDIIGQWIREARTLPYEEMKIRSFDGLDLYAKYYEFAPNAPIEIMFHGYRGTAERDLAGGIQRAFKLGRSVVLVDQRCSGKSGGNTISFGVNEHKDCLMWVEHVAKRFGADVKIILTGISMGASTVLMAADKDLPGNVVGILADCGFSTAKDIIKKVIRQMHLPASLLYPFVKLAAKIFGHFDLEEHSALEAMKKSRLPVIFIHGESDDYVPCEMSRINFEACISRKAILTVPKAGHGLSYPAAPEEYLNALREFFGEDCSHESVR